MKKVLVTGSKGFLGLHMVRSLKQRGFDVTELVEPGTIVMEGNCISCNIADLGDSASRGGLNFKELVEELKQQDAIIHLGAQISIPLSIKDPELFMKTNTMGTFYLLQAAREAGIKIFLATSTSEVYGTAQYTPIDEKHPICPQSPYAASKAAADSVCHSFYRSYGFPVVIMRPFNMTGPGQSDRALIPTLISQVLTKDEIKVGRLDTLRDYVDARDVAEIYTQVLVKNDVSMYGNAHNIATGKSYSGLQVLNMISDITGKNPKIIIDKERMRGFTSEVEVLKGDSSKLSKLLTQSNFSILGPKSKPGYTYRELEDTLKDTIEYIKQNPEKYNPNKYNI